MGCSVLVQGCWVVDSHVIYPEASDAAKRNARDYIVRMYVLINNRFFVIKQLSMYKYLTNEELSSLKTTKIDTTN